MYGGIVQRICPARDAQKASGLFECFGTNALDLQ